MTAEQPEREADQDPQPVKESDAERASQADEPSSEDIEDDPAYEPPEGPLRDLKGG